MIANTASLISKPWPFEPNAEYHMMRADEVSLWEFELVTGFGRLAYSNIVRCDLRVIDVIQAGAIPTAAVEPTPTPVPDTPPKSEPASAAQRRQQENKRLRLELNNWRKEGMVVQPDKATAELLWAAYEEKHGTTKLTGKERDKRLRAIVGRLVAWLSDG
jgi:hypothetical protein